jgi:hypothetical protein
MVRLLKVTALVFAAVVMILACLSIFLFLQACSDQMSACYRAWKSPDSTKRERLGALTQFTASATAIAFPVLLDNGERAVLFVERKTGRSKLIYDKDKVFSEPHLSADGNRLVLIQRHVGLAHKEIITCSIATWQCAVRLRTEDNLHSPVEIDANTIVYAASPLFISSEGHHRYRYWDLYLSRTGSTQMRLSDFRLHRLDMITVAGDKVIFTGEGNNPVLPESEPLARDRSQIYAVELDQQAQTIRKPPGRLTPLFMIGGFSWSASVSRDGRHAAVYNTKTDRAYYRWDLVLATMDGSVQRRIDLEGIGFSPGAFVGEMLLFNELFEDRYDVRLLDLASGVLESILHVEHSPDKLRALERIRLVVDDEPQKDSPERVGP